MAGERMSQERRDAFRRIQIGIAGIAGVVLLVTLANMAREGEAGVLESDATIAENATTDEAAPNPNEPLAELGVTPSDPKAQPTPP